MYLDQYEMQRYIQASAARGDLQVKWEVGAVPRTDGGTMYLPHLSDKASEKEYRQLLHYATHEADHVLYTDFKTVKETGLDPTKSFLGMLWNMTEDHRAEWLGTREYEGDRLNSDFVYEDMWNQVIGSAKEAAKDPTKKAAIDKIVPLLAFMNECHGDMYPSASNVAPEVEKLLTPEGKKYLDKLRSGDYRKVLRNARDIAEKKEGTKATLDLAKRIFKEVFEEDPEKEIKEAQAQAQKGKGKKSEEGESQPGEGEGDGEGEGEGEDKDGEGQPEKGKMGKEDSEGKGKPRKKKVTVNYQDFAPTPHVHSDPKAERPPEAGMHIDYSMYKPDSYHTYTPATKDEFMVADFPKGKHSTPEMVEDRHGYSQGQVDNYKSCMTVGGQGFAARVRQRLQVRSRDRFEYAKKRGKLHQSSLYRVTLKDVPGMNERVFKQKIVSDTLDTCVSVVVDTSGSMGGEKYGHAMVSAALLNDAIGNVLQIPLEVTGFTDRGRRPVMYVHRDFATRRLPTDELVKRMAIAGCRMSGNPDGDCVLWAYDRIKMQKAKRKVMIVLSDGSPACGRGGNIYKYTKDVVAKIAKESSVEIVGIGIMDTNVTGIYPEHYVINDAGELEHALLSLIDKKMT